METENTDPLSLRSYLLPLVIGITVLAVLVGLSLFGASVYRQATHAAASRNPVIPVFSPDGAQLAISVGERTEIYDGAAYTPRLRLESAAGGTEAGLSFSPDGSTLQVNRGAWNTTSGGGRYQLQSAESFRVVYAPDGSRVASFSFDGLYVWDSLSGAQVTYIATASGCACQTALAFAGRDQLVSAAIDGVKTWRISDGEKLAQWKREGFANALALSSDGRLVAFSEKDRVELWDVANGQKIRDFETPPGAVNLLVFSTDDRLLAGEPGGSGAAVWAVESGQLVHSFALPAKVAGLAFSPDGARLAAGAYDGQMRIFDLAAGALAHTINDFTDWRALVVEAILD
jgi:WD40 repeat protein